MTDVPTPASHPAERVAPPSGGFDFEGCMAILMCQDPYARAESAADGTRAR